ncbi:MAG: hypothetical protein KDD13_00385 [Mangrovimonas sp.]|nr:hypothetical protein [Mangrovimonas sp.]
MKKRWKNPEYAEYISRLPCIDCGCYHGMDRFGTPRVDASHVKTKGAGGEEYNNLIPQCRPCHFIFEKKTRSQRSEYKKLAEKITEMYFEQVLDTLDDDSYPPEF